MDWTNPLTWGLVVIVGLFAWAVATFCRDWWQKPLLDELERATALLQRAEERAQRAERTS